MWPFLMLSLVVRAFQLYASTCAAIAARIAGILVQRFEHAFGVKRAIHALYLRSASCAFKGLGPISLSVRARKLGCLHSLHLAAFHSGGCLVGRCDPVPDAVRQAAIRGGAVPGACPARGRHAGRSRGRVPGQEDSGSLTGVQRLHQQVRSWLHPMLTCKLRWKCKGHPKCSFYL